MINQNQDSAKVICADKTGNTVIDGNDLLKGSVIIMPDGLTDWQKKQIETAFNDPERFTANIKYQKTLSPILDVKLHREVSCNIAIVDADGTILSDKYPIVEYNVLTKEAKYVKFEKSGIGIKLDKDADGKEVTETIVFPNSHLEFIS